MEIEDYSNLQPSISRNIYVRHARRNPAIIMPMKRVVNLILFGLLLVACNTTTPADDSAPVVNVEPTVSATGVPANAEATAAAELSAPTSVPTQSLEPAAEVEPTMVVELTEAPATVTSEPTSTSPAGMNGRNDDGTFYRGAADAPVTIIEYSDFL